MVLAARSRPSSNFDELYADSLLVPREVVINHVLFLNGEALTQAFFVADRAYLVTAFREIHATAGTDAGAVTLQLVKDTGTDAPGAGTDLLTAGVNMKGTANTLQSGTLIATVATKTLAAGNRLAVEFTGTPTVVAGVVVSVTLAPV